MSEVNSRVIRLDGITFWLPSDGNIGAVYKKIPGTGYGSPYIDTLIYGAKWSGSPTYSFLPGGAEVTDEGTGSSE